MSNASHPAPAIDAPGHTATEVTEELVALLREHALHPDYGNGRHPRFDRVVPAMVTLDDELEVLDGLLLFRGSETVRLTVEIVDVMEQDHGAPAEQLDERYNQDGTGEHPLFPKSAWVDAVRAGMTVEGYWFWVELQIAQAHERAAAD